MTRRQLLTAGGGVAAAVLMPGLAGCGGGGGGGKSIGEFTVTPSRAAPGAIVTLTGITNLQPGDEGGVTFGGVPAIINSWDADGLKVVVPPFFQKGTMTHTPPIAPVAVAVQLAGATPKAAGNSFTVDPLIPAPGMAQQVTTELHAMSLFFEDFFKSALLPIFANADTGASANDLPAIMAGYSFCGAAADALAGPDNPNSLKAALDGTAPLLGGHKLPVELLDSMFAQANALSGMNDLAQKIADMVAAMNPAAVTTRSAPHATRDTDLQTTFSQLGINWSNLSAAQTVVATLQVQRFLQQISNSPTSNVATLLYTLGAMVAHALLIAIQAVATVDPQVAAGFLLADTCIGLGQQVLAVISTVLPAQISDFYVLIAGKNRRSGDPAVDIAIDPATPIKIYIIPQSAGGGAFTLAGLASNIVSVLKLKVPGLSTVMAKLGDELQLVEETFVSRLLGIVDTVWSLAANSGPVAQWKTTQAMNFPQFKYPKVNINDDRVVLMKINSPALIKSVDNPGDHSYAIQGVHTGNNAGYEVSMRVVQVIPGMPSLADLATDAKNHVIGIVNVVSGTAGVNID